jgi:hypothetical protein
LPKKIKFHLLLADLALQFGDARARRFKLSLRKVGRWWLRPRLVRSQVGRRSLARPTPTAQRLGTACQEAIAPNVQILARKLQLTRKRGHVLARQHPAHYADLKRPAENTV